MHTLNIATFMFNKSVIIVIVIVIVNNAHIITVTGNTSFN